MIRVEWISRFSLALASSMLLFLAGAAVPWAGVLLIPLAPQPVLVFGVRYGLQKSIYLLLLANLFFFLFGGGALAVGYFLLSLMVVLLFLSFGRGRSIESMVVATAAGMASAVGAALLYAFGSLSGISQALRESLKENLDKSAKIYEQFGFSQESLEILKERAPQLIELVVQILPALAFVSFGTLVLINLLLLCKRFPEKRSWLVAAENLREWKAPEALVWCLILPGFALFLPVPPTIKLWALNLLLVIGVFYFCQGLAIIAYYLHKTNVPFFLRGLTYVLIIFEQIFTLIVVGLGLFDLWGDFRRLKKKNFSPGEVS